METRLLKTFAPLEDESGLGYYRRLSAANALNGWKELARLSEVSGTRSGLFSRPEYVATMLGVDSAACRVASAREEIALGWRGLRRTGFDAVCPHCLKDSPHLKLEWDHVYTVACPIHKTLLVDKCDGCGHRLPDQREQIAICACGHDITASQPKPATSAQLWVACVIASRGTDSGGWLPALSAVHTDLFSLLVRNLCHLFEPSLTAVRQNAASPKTVQEAVEFLKPLEYLLYNWPQGFETHVRDRIASGQPHSRTLNTKLGKWYARLKDLGPDDTLNPFLDVVHHVAVREYAGVLALDHVAGFRGRAKSHLMLPDAAARIGVHRNTLVKAVAAGEVASFTRPYANRGVTREIPIDEVDAIATSRKGWVSEAQAREVLNVPESVFDNMTQAGLVVPDYAARLDIRRGAPIERAALERLQARLLGGRLRERGNDAERLQLKELQVRKLGDKKAIVRLFKAVESGDVLPVARAKSVGELEFLRSDVATFFSATTVEAGMTVQALSNSTGWKWESISHWIDEGLLGSAPAVLRGQPCRVVLPEHLIQFSSKYVPLATLAQSLGSRSSELRERLGSIEMLGARPLANGAVRGALIRLSDLAQAALLPAFGERTDVSQASHSLVLDDGAVS